MILREIAHEISSDPDRVDRPQNAAEARARLDVYLSKLKAEAPRAGLGAATGQFADHLGALLERYESHIFVCFDNPRVPPSTNALEAFFGRAKRPLRRSCGTGSTANSVAQNVGGDYLAAFALAEKNDDLSFLLDKLAARQHVLARFRDARARLLADELPMTRRRSLVRNFNEHVARLRTGRGLAMGRADPNA